MLGFCGYTWACLQLWCIGFSLQWLLLQLRSTASGACGLSGCNAGAQWLWRLGSVATWHVESSQTRDSTCVPCIGRQILNNWTTREVLSSSLNKSNDSPAVWTFHIHWKPEALVCVEPPLLWSPSILPSSAYGFNSVLFYCLLFSSSCAVQFSCSVVSVSWWPHVLQHARLPCSSPTPGACSNSCPSSRWCHPTISCSIILFSSCLQFFPASGSFPMSQYFPSGGQTVGASVSVSVLPVNIQEWFPLGWTGLISLQSKGLSRFFSNATVQKHQFFGP